MGTLGRVYIHHPCTSGTDRQLPRERLNGPWGRSSLRSVVFWPAPLWIIHLCLKLHRCISRITMAIAEMRGFIPGAMPRVRGNSRYGNNMTISFQEKNG